MRDRRDERCDHDRPRRDHDGDRRRDGEHGSGPDTRFLQLEMSEVLYSEAEGVTKQALRELLLEAAKARFRERFGDRIAGLAELAVDELMQDVLASLEVEDRVRRRNSDRQDRRERLASILGMDGGSDACDDGNGDKSGNAPDDERT